MRVKSFPLRTLSLAVALSIPMVAAHAGVTGNIGVYSKYILRGITNAPESDSAVLQGGFDYAADNGIYVGYWGSTLGYGKSTTTTTSYPVLDSGGTPTGDTISVDSTSSGSNGFENDLYAGWAGKSGDISYSLGIIQYYYMNVPKNFNLTEFNPTIGYGPVTLGAKYLLTDGAWGNQGDIYWTVSYSADLPSDFKLGAVAGFYTYNGDASAKMCGTDSVTGAALDCTTESSAFRHVDLTLSHPIAKTGADMSLTYTLGGKDRTGTDQKDALWFGVKYGFGI